MSLSPDQPCSCSALRQAARRVTRLYDAALAPVGLSLNQYAVLSQVSRSGPSAQGDLAERLVMDRSTLGHLLRPLQARGLLHVTVDPEDRRRKLLSVSQDGRRLLESADPLWAQAEATFREAFGLERAQRLRTTLARVIDAMPDAWLT